MHVPLQFNEVKDRFENRICERTSRLKEKNTLITIIIKEKEFLPLLHPLNTGSL